MRSYHSHLGHTANATLPLPVARKPVFRSSAIFPAFRQPGLTTRIGFLGYWMVKRKIPEIHSVLTLRSSAGDMLLRRAERIADSKAYRAELDDLLADAGWAEETFTGSLEIEFFASRDLVYPYPAVIVNYYGPEFGTVVHTAQRVFNDAEDRSANRETSVPEAGFNVYADEDREPFFAFVNGFEPVVGGRVAMTFFNAFGESLASALDIPLLAPYETTVVYPDRHVDLRAFLRGRPGTAKIAFDVDWVFPRIVAGNAQRSRQALSVTHTYYDCSGSATDADYWPLSPEGYHPASLYVPVTASDYRYTNIHFYPIYSPSELEVDVELYDAEGALLGARKGLHTIRPDDAGFHTIGLRPLCESLGIDTAQPIGANLIARPAAGQRLPTRLKIGLDYGEGEDALPCNICKTMEVCNPALEAKTGSFHWGPVLTDQADAVVWLVNSCPKQGYDRFADLTLAFYREQDAEVLARPVRLAPNGIRELRLSEDPELRAFLGEGTGWYVATSANPYVKSYYLCESRSGIVGGDHDF
ncbi:hypothetical protein [Cohnella nanjingensis]|uniref:Uncharacterized protein n=1 Tax=Cohnella nanjingensis TaxID=1387779 RepID=A0A7X0RQB1_9BACL|nr:hypothetical protein [Cohnella nanjingensis]MBB6671703.1 hypothetical protein [Cohnella nanjingensis]